MSSDQDRLTKLLADAKRKAYERGWKDATAAITKAAATTQPNIPGIVPADAPVDLPRGRPAWAMKLVREAVQTAPGLRGVELVKAINDRGNDVAERTVRTCLRRLRKSREIWQRNGRWYPKSKEEPEKARGETVTSSPH